MKKYGDNESSYITNAPRYGTFFTSCRLLVGLTFNAC